MNSHDPVYADVFCEKTNTLETLDTLRAERDKLHEINEKLLAKIEVIQRESDAALHEGFSEAYKIIEAMRDKLQTQMREEMDEDYATMEVTLQQGDDDDTPSPASDSLYLHVGNSGVTFTVMSSDLGPKIVIGSSSFGNLVTSQEIYTTQKALVDLAKLFLKASKWEFTEPYCHCASPPGQTYGGADCQSYGSDDGDDCGDYYCDGCDDADDIVNAVQMNELKEQNELLLKMKSDLARNNE